MIYHGDLFDFLPTLEAESIDACVTDPPYGIGFMGKAWDGIAIQKAAQDRRQNNAKGNRPDTGRTYTHSIGEKPSLQAGEYDLSRKGLSAFQSWVELWATEILRVLKPGGHVLVFGSPRTFHRLTCGIEDAGFEIRDCLMFLYGTGFPKSLNIGCKCRGNALPYNHDQALPERDVRPLFGADVSTSVNAEHESREVLLKSLSKQGASGDRPSHGSGFDERRKQSSLEGRELHRAGEGLSTDPNAEPSEVAPERLRSRAYRGGGTDAGSKAKVRRGGSPQGSGSSEQRSGESTDLRLPSEALDDRASRGRSICQECGGIKGAEGQGTALKPGFEPIILARKPLVGTVAANVQTHGTGAINIDACRINPGAFVTGGGNGKASNGASWTGSNRSIVEPHDLGRWPSNVLLDEDAAAMLDEQTGELNGQEFRQTGVRVSGDCLHGVGISGKKNAPDHYGDTGGASRFYYVAKPSREERDYGCDRLPPMTAGQATDRTDGTAGLNSPRAGSGRTGGSRNGHPTVKPVELMRWLVKLVTPPGGLVLDPFTGSGTTGMACRYEQRRFIGIEREANYAKIAEERIAAVAPLFGDLTA